MLNLHLNGGIIGKKHTNMFKKTITRLAYSPTLAGELTDYARKLRQEEVKRQVGLIFVGLALVVQSFAVLFPPESANAGNSADFITGGFRTIDDYLKYYDQNTYNVKDLLTSLGISRSNIQDAHLANVEKSSDLILWKMTSRGGVSDIPYDFLKSDGTIKTAYAQPLGFVEGASPKTDSGQYGVAYAGFSSSAGPFMLLKNSGNLVTKDVISKDCTLYSSLPATVPAPVSLKDIERCSVKLIQNFSARNLSASVPATLRSAQAADRIVYTLSVTNNDNRTVSIPFSISLADILEYADLIDRGGATFSNETRTLTWTGITLSPGASQSRSFIIKLLPVIPSTAKGTNDASSYDCIMSSSFGKTLNVPVACPFAKAIEQTTNELPSVPLHTNVAFAIIVASVSAFFYARSRELRTELRLIRHNHQGSL
jgi:hypothetical protein